MSSPAPLLSAHSARDLLGALVRSGIVEFGRRTIPSIGGFYDALESEAQTQLGLDKAPEWATLLADIRAQWPLERGALGRLIGDYDLSLEEAFLLVLVGEVEASHLLTMTLNQLQAPTAAIRPSVHLCQAVLTMLFGDGAINPQSLSGSRLIQDQIIIMEGEGPLPLRNLRMEPHLWAILCDLTINWPGTSAINNMHEGLLPQAILGEIPKLVDLLRRGETSGLVVRGVPGSGRADFACELAKVMGMQAVEIQAQEWERQAVLSTACRYARWLPVIRTQLGPGEVWRPPRDRAVAEMLLVLMGTDGAVENGNMLEVALSHPQQQERHVIWKRLLDSPSLADKLADTAILSGTTIHALATNARLIAQRLDEVLDLKHVAEARRQLGAERLRLLAQPVHRHITTESLVLPTLVINELDSMIARCRSREAMWQELGITLQATRNLGVRALLVGESGTGKTLAASYIATALGAPLYRVDLASVMNKYIGESEKNLAQLLDQAAANDIVLLFDEADSLFGRRSEGKETGERYANMLTNFLLTRIESHPGIVLLTSNSRERIDGAFTRRLDFITEFPIPGYEERFLLWQSHLGNRGPGEKIYKYLASYSDLAGGQIRNVVLAAAARSIEGKIVIGDIFYGLESEYRKLGRSLPAKLAQLKQEAVAA